jgi:chromosome segregation ATPase
MGEDFTQKLPANDRDLILTAIKNMETYVRSSIDNLVTWITSVDTRLSGLEQKLESRLHDTRPIWHKVVADISQLQTSQDEMRGDLREINRKTDTITRDQAIFNDALHKVQGDFHVIDERLRRLEVNRNPSNSST